MKKRITSLLLTLAMLLSLLPAMGVTASAAEPEWTTVNSYEELQTAVKDKKEYIKLGRDIDTTNFHSTGSGLEVEDWLTFENQTCTLDLNGKTLTLMTRLLPMGVFLRVYDGSNLTIKDSSPAKTGAITGAFKNYISSDAGCCLFHVHGGSSLTLENGSFTVTSAPHEDHADTVRAMDSNITIKEGVTISHPGKFYPEHSYIDLDGNSYALRTDGKCKVIIDGGVFDGHVKLSGYQDTNGSVQINGGTFKKDVQVLYTAEENNSNPAVTVNGGTFEGTVYLQRWSWEESLYMPYRLNGGTFKGTVDLCADDDIYEKDKPTGNPNIALGLNECFGYSAVVTPTGTFAGPNAHTAVILEKLDHFGKKCYKMLLQGTASDPVRIIPNAWGMKSVTLDGPEINYAKDWQGAVEKMDDSTAHTIKFTWKDLAQELKDAHYSYRAECDRYISGNKTPETDKNLTGTEYSFTIPAGADPKVYSFDLQLNLKKDDSPYNIGIISNEHIVKLVVNQAPVVVPDPTLAGNVYYTSGIVYGRSISIAPSVTPAEATKSYQWQRSTDSGSTWKNIEGATSGKYTPVEADMGENVRIRVKITANGYLGEIVGAAVKVSKADNNNYPEVIQLEAVKNGENYTGFKITNFDSDCEYVYSTTSTPDWSKNQISSATVTGLTSNTTYYVFARFKETNTHTAGSIVSKNSIMLYDYVPLDRVLLEGYGSYGKIYIKQGESVTLKLSTDPSNVNYWNKITFKERGTATGCITVDNAEIAASGENAASFSDHTIKITGVSEGRATLIASYPSATESFYGTWDVVVYDDPADALRFENVYTYKDITLSVNDTAELPTELPTLLPEGSGYKPEWRIVKVGSGAAYSESDENITLENGKIKPIKAHTGSASTRLELVAVNGTTVKSLSPSSVFNVTVTKAPTIALTGVTVAPTKVNLDLNANKTCQLSAVKEPVNAKGTLNWESSNTGVATVDGTGKVTAKAQGTAIITVSCGDKKATCTVTVDHTHDYTGQSWVYMDPGTHTMTCTAGDNTKYEPHNWQWVVDTHATSTTAGKKHEECPDCHAKRSENTVIPATGGGSSSGGGSTGGGGGAGVTTYAITVQNSKNAAVTASHNSAAKDTAVTLTVTPDKGYVLDTLTVLDSKDKAVKLTQKNGKYTFTMPSGKVMVTAAFKAAAPASENPFTDVPSGAYYEDAVIWAVKKGITSGTSATTFDPDGSCTRAQAVTFLWRAAGSPEPKSATMPFTDVPAGSYFEKAVLWAVENRITKGTSDTTFSPDASCTRAQIVTFLWRAGGSPAVSGNSAFSDVAADAYYAAAVAWAEKNGVTGGIGGGLFGSDNTCTRAQIVTFLHRAMK